MYIESAILFITFLFLIDALITHEHSYEFASRRELERVTRRAKYIGAMFIGEVFYIGANAIGLI